MKKMVFGLSLALAALGFLVSPAFAADPQRPGAQELNAADRSFVASLASRAPKAPEAPRKRPPAGWEKALCGATAACGGGVTVSCTSNSSVTSCSAADRNCAAGEQGHVTCAGVTTWCPGTCPCSSTVSCGNGTSVTCSGNSCSTANRNCAAGEQGHVTCDGVTTTCSNACPPCSVTAFCGSGTPVSCSGNTCSGADQYCNGWEDGHVTCDGVTTTCSNTCGCPLDWCTGEQDCAQQCGSCPYRYTCNELNCTDNCSCDFRFCEIQ
ncbi:MAG TPA: hypothetical protein VF173_06545 [Thermoanaerobaculia bacterium]|nr:hypothetical protein [Thermoanaerobaculia bacterium]